MESLRMLWLFDEFQQFFYSKNDYVVVFEYILGVCFEFEEYMKEF